MPAFRPTESLAPLPQLAGIDAVVGCWLMPTDEGVGLVPMAPGPVMSIDDHDLRIAAHRTRTTRLTDFG